jgi:hypothetical protein
LLLAGAAAAVLAAAGPEYHARMPSRRVALAIYPSAELGGAAGAEALREAAGRLLDRLAGEDRVQLVLPALQGGAGGWLTPGEAREKLKRLTLLPVPAAELKAPQPDASAAHVYIFAAAGTRKDAGPKVSIVELPTQLPRVTIEAAGATLLPDGRVKLLVAVRNNSRGELRLRVRSAMLDQRGRARRTQVSSEIDLAPGGQGEVVEFVEDSAALSAAVTDQEGSDVSDPGFLARRQVQIRRALMLGRDEPLLRKFVRVHPGLIVTGDTDQADLAIANGVDPPRGKPAFVIDPPSSPAGWRRGEALEYVVLDELSVAPDPIMADVQLSGVAVRRVRPWAPLTGSWDQSIARDSRGAFILKSADRARTKRVYLAFDLAEPNTNFGTLAPDFVIFLANVIDFLVPGKAGQTSFTSHTPLQADADWEPLGPPSKLQRAGPLPWPGIYRDAAGKLRAVSLTGLTAAQPKVPPDQAVAEMPLPQPQYARYGIALWPALAAAAGILWLLGWAARVR